MSLFRVFLVGLLITLGAPLSPTLAADNIEEDFGDSVEVSLLTCSPHDEVYSLYGHTAIHYKNLKTHEDYAFSYGIFSFKKPFFVARFALGKTDYELGVIPFAAFCNEYRHFGSMVTEQVINLTPAEKARLIATLKENYKPENRVYRYNFFYDNCATRVRDVIVKSIDGKVIYGAMDGEKDTSWRDIIHSYTILCGHNWAAFGNDLCLGLKADRPTTQLERHFIPDNLMLDFAKAQIYSNGTYRPLVSEVRMPVEAGVQFVEDDFPLTPVVCSLIFFVICVVISIVEYRRKKSFVVWDTLLMMILGVAGLVMTVLLVSEHPATTLNLQYLLLNPLPLFFLPKVIRRRKTSYWKISTILILLYFLGGFLQHYAEGMILLAPSLLTRVYINQKFGKNDNR